MKKILITGATGFIGKHLSQHICSHFQDSKIFLLVRKESNLQGLPESAVAYHYQDNADLNQLFEENQFEWVIHLATKYVHEPTLDEVNQIVDCNVKLGTLILELMRKQNSKKFLNVSTFSEFNDQGENLPNSYYSHSKKWFRETLELYKKNHQIKSSTLFLYDTYGENDQRKKLLHVYVDSVKNSRQLKMSPGEQIIAPIYVGDLVLAFVRILENQDLLGSDYFVPGPAWYNLKEIAAVVESVYQKKMDIEWGAYDYRPGEIMRPFVGELIPGFVAQKSLKQFLREQM